MEIKIGTKVKDSAGNIVECWKIDEDLNDRKYFSFKLPDTEKRKDWTMYSSITEPEVYSVFFKI